MSRAEEFLNKRTKQKGNLVITREEAIKALDDYGNELMQIIESTFKDKVYTVRLEGVNKEFRFVSEEKYLKSEETNKMLDELLEKYDLKKFAEWIVNNGYSESDLITENGVEEYLNSLE